MNKRLARLLRRTANRLDPQPKPASWIASPATYTSSASDPKVWVFRR